MQSDDNSRAQSEHNCAAWRTYRSQTAFGQRGPERVRPR
jgi:hypothetical protein